MSLSQFHPIIRQWFTQQLGEPTEPQRLGWPHIAAKKNTLIAAPTGSGKTLAAFLVCIDGLLRDWLDGRLSDQMQVLYISPLKALSNDIHRNLEAPLEAIGRLAEQGGLGRLPIRTMVRTGDTPPAERQRMARRPPHILVTTPESLYLILTSPKSRNVLRSVKTVIVDEIHALARDKRGSHLSLSLERLEALCDTAPLRIGLSATQRPIDQIAKFLVGASCVDTSRRADCEVVDAGHVRELDAGIEVPPSELCAVCSHEQWAEIYGRLTELIDRHRSTLIFVNTRRLAERVAHHLVELLGEEAVASHHGSLSKQIRHDAEQRLKTGQLRAIVATASLEMGIDVGFIDLVCQIGSPRSIATFLQRVGRSGHSLGLVPKGRLFPLTRDELIECLALVRAVRRGDLDRIEIPTAPLDILAQQIVAAVACEDWDEDALYGLCRRAWPYRNLQRAQFDEIVRITSEGMAPGVRRGAHLHRDAIHSRLRARRGARISATTSGGAIPETADYRVVTEPEKTLVGTVDEDFAIESSPGDIFLLGTTSWRIRSVRSGEVVVQDAQGAPPSVPFWFGESPGRTEELSLEVSRMREQIAARAAEKDGVEWLERECGATAWAAEQAVSYIRAGQAAIGLVPTSKQIVFERFFDESGGMQLVVHAPLGARINRAWGLAFRKRFCRSFDFELQASADDNGIVLSLGPQHSFSIDSLFKLLGTHNAQHILQQALLDVPMFQVRWRWNVTRALAVLRHRGGKKVPLYLQRMQSDDLLAAVFPDQVGCGENHGGDIEIPDHVLVQQTMHDCLHEAMDLDGWLKLLANMQNGDVQLIARDTREPSPFSHELLNANPYAFLDPAPLEERRTRAVATRRSLSADDMQDLGRLDPAAIAQVSNEAWPLVRDVDEMHDALMSLVAITPDEAHGWTSWLDQLAAAGRATTIVRNDHRTLWIAAERLPVVRAVYDTFAAEPPLQLPDHLEKLWQSTDALVELARGRMQHSGPISAQDVAAKLGLETGRVAAALEALEGEGTVLRGQFTCPPTGPNNKIRPTIEWCDRRLLARIHRLTLDGLRKRIQPVEPEHFLQFLVRHHQVLRVSGSDDISDTSGQKRGALHGTAGVRESIQRLQGFEMPAGAWERKVLANRIQDYDPQWLDSLFLSGELMWGRLSPPRRDADSGPSMSVLTRTVPISLLAREDLPWLLPNERTDASPSTRANAQRILEVLTSRGALFFQELATDGGLLASHLDEALRELAALGLVTSDGFGSVRAMIDRAEGHRRRGNRATASAPSPVGRWTLFPGSVTESPQDHYHQRWCWQLLARYGVVFRDLLARETAAPPWYRLVPVFRRLERRGEIRGGRFVNGVAGEQYGTETAIRSLRGLRDEPPDGSWVVISAADPLNLVGIIIGGPRVPAVHTNALILAAGRPVAVKQAGQVEFLAETDPGTSAVMTRALYQCRRPSPVRKRDTVAAQSP